VEATGIIVARQAVAIDIYFEIYKTLIPRFCTPCEYAQLSVFQVILRLQSSYQHFFICSMNICRSVSPRHMGKTRVASHFARHFSRGALPSARHSLLGHVMTSDQKMNDLFRTAFSNLPTEANSRLDALFQLNGVFRRAIAGQLKPVVRTLLQEQPPEDEKGRRDLAPRLNHILRDMGLAIVDPDSGKPASVVADAYRIRLRTRVPDGEGDKRTYSSNTQSLTPLELVECPRTEPFLTWHERTSERNSPHKKRSDGKPGRA
jgi:hypothetical protein